MKISKVKWKLRTKSMIMQPTSSSPVSHLFSMCIIQFTRQSSRSDHIRVSCGHHSAIASKMTTMGRKRLATYSSDLRASRHPALMEPAHSIFNPEALKSRAIDEKSIDETCKRSAPPIHKMNLIFLRP